MTDTLRIEPEPITVLVTMENGVIHDVQVDAGASVRVVFAEADPDSDPGDAPIVAVRGWSSAVAVSTWTPNTIDHTAPGTEAILAAARP